MQKGKLNCALILLVWLSRVTCNDPCLNGSCPVTSGGKDTFLPGKWECAICGTKGNPGPPECLYKFEAFLRKSSKKCKIKKDYCSSNECVKENTIQCQENCLTEYCCICKDNFVGHKCNMPQTMEFDFSARYDGSMKVLVDQRDRPACWLTFIHHDLNWKSGQQVSVVIVAGKDINNHFPFTACVLDLVGEVILDKFTRTITKEESEKWCTTSTNLGPYCQRFNLLFEGNEVKRIMFFELQLPFIDSDWPSYFTWSLYYFNNTLRGYTHVCKSYQFSFPIYPPHFRYFRFRDDKTLGTESKITFNNQTQVDSTCVPRIDQLCNTEYTGYSGAKFTHTTVSMQMTYRPPPSECTETSIARWQVFKEAVNSVYSPGSEVFTREGCCSLTIPPYTLTVGAHIVRFTMMHIQQGNAIYNTKSCILTITRGKLMAKVNEIVKLVNEEEFNWVTVEAYDINRPPKEQKTNLFFTWSCLFNGTEEPCTKLDHLFMNAPSIKIPPNTLKVNSTYKFIVLVQSLDILEEVVEDYSNTLYQKLIVTSVETSKLIRLRCETCDDSLMINPQEYNIIVIRAKDGISPPFNDHYEWKFAEEVKGVIEEFKTVQEIREGNGSSTHSIVMKIKKYVLKYETPYVFQAMSSYSKTFAQIRVTTAPLPPLENKNFNCILNPKEGVRGVTNFDLKCELKDELLLFEYYDKDENDENEFSGRMLGYNEIGSLSNFKITRGKLFVLVFNNLMVKSTYTLNVPLVPFDGTLKYLEGVLKQARGSTESNQFDWPSATVSSVADVMTRNMTPPTEIVIEPVLILHRVRVGHILGLSKLVLSSLRTILNNINREFDILKVDAHITKSAAEILSAIALKLTQREMNMKKERTLTPTAFYETIKAVLDCTEIILEQKPRELESKPRDYVIPSISDLVESTSLTLISILDIVIYSLGRQQIPGDITKEVVSGSKHIFTSTKVDFATNLSEWTLLTENCPVVVSKELISSIGLTSELLGLQYIRMNINPFWWAGGNIISEVLLVHICERTKLIDCRKLTRFKDFVSIRLKVIKPLDHIFPIEGTAYQIDPTTTEENKELKLTVYKFFLPEKAKLFFKFFLNDSQEYKIKLRSDGIRPSYAEIVKSNYLISTNSCDYDVPYDIKHSDEKVYYLGILPSSSKVSVGEKVPFQLKAYYSLCNSWVRWQWSSYGCWVGAKTDEGTIHCDCNHLSVVAGSITTPDHIISTVTEFTLFLTPWENLLPIFILLLIALFYPLLIIWSVMKIRVDERQGEIIVLEDNFPGERYSYLIGVYTGSRLFSGTSSTVGIKLYGDVDDSRSHILKSRQRNVMSNFSEDWFLLFTPLHLGEIRRLCLWHNDEGCGPDWYVEKVEVYDLKTKTIYMFEINMWLAMEVNAYPELYVTPVKIDEYFSTMNIFRYNFVNCLRDTHSWASICLKHPRNPVSRVERVSAVVCFILLAMSVSLLLYTFHFGSNIDEDKPSYYLDTSDLIIFILTLIIASIVSCFIMESFRKSFSHSFNRFISTPSFMRNVSSHNVLLPGWDKSSTNLRTKSMDHLHSSPSEISIRFDIRLRPHHKRTECEKFILNIQKIVHGNSLLPVRLPGTESDLIVHKTWLITAWILCITTILLSGLIILLKGWKLPTIKDVKFLSVFFGVVVFDAVIVSLLKVLLLSALLSYKFLNISPGTIYHMKSKDRKRLHLTHDNISLARLLQMRQNPIYFPLSGAVKEIKRKHKTRKYKWRLLMDFLMTVLLVCVISIICRMYYIDKYTSNAHAAHMMTAGKSTSVPSLTEIINRTELYNFMETSYVDHLYRYTWYNGLPFLDSVGDRKDWSNDCVMRLLGNTRIRQLRVPLENCLVNNYFRDTIQFCAPPWSREEEDKDVYSPSWRIADYKETTRKRSSWKYTEAKISNSSRFYGQSGTLYHGGGYITELGNSKRETRGTLLTLDMEGWLDHMTRVVFVELTLYNVNTDLFTQVVFVSEQHPTGQYISIPKVGSVTINIGFNLWNVGFVIFQVFFLFKALYLVNRLGVFGYLSNVLNIFELYLLILGFATVIVYLVHVKYSSFYVEEFYRKGFDEFFSFFEIIRYDFMSKAIMCFLFVSAMVKVLLSWRFGKIYFYFYYSLSLSWLLIFWLTVYFIICLVIVWRFIGYKMNVYLFPYYSSPIVYTKDFKITGVHKRCLEHLVVYLMCILSYLVNILFFAFFTRLYKEERILKPQNTQNDESAGNFSFVEFLTEEIKICKRYLSTRLNNKMNQ